MSTSRHDPARLVLTASSPREAAFGGPSNRFGLPGVCSVVFVVFAVFVLFGLFGLFVAG